MSRFLFISVVFIFGYQHVFSQQIPANKCGIQYTYDAAGNRTKQEYYCNVPFKAPDPVAFAANQTKASINKDSLSSTTSFVQVEALYPNPTDGRFSVRFSQELKNALITLQDLSGRRLQQFKASGFVIDFDISRLPSGTYLLNISNGKNSIVEKVIKER